MIRLPREAQVWLPAYCRDLLRRRLTSRPPVQRLWVAICDHFEPLFATSDENLAAVRVAAWRQNWPGLAQRHRDSTGRPPQYSFFYPQEEYRPNLLEPLAEMVRLGLGDVEIHIHHGGEGRDEFIHRMSGFQHVLHDRHGLLRRNGSTGKLSFGFIHGNWCLDNSNPDGSHCGLNDELSILRDLGCYADFTMPSGAHPSQSRTINRIYWAKDDPERPKSYDHGVDFVPGTPIPAGDLLMIPGPFGFTSRPNLRPMLETGEIAGYSPMPEGRAESWLELAPRIGADAFLKLYTHGTQERTCSEYFGGRRVLDAVFDSLSALSSRLGLSLRYVTAWEMYQAICDLPAVHPA